MTGRTIAIGDIHGCRAAFDQLLQAIAPQSSDEIIVLGDVIDRGPESRQVIDRLLTLAGLCRLVTIRGNHEEMLLAARDPENAEALYMWLRAGGAATLDSYGFRTRPADLPPAHWEFIAGCVAYYETPTHAFLHASYDADLFFAEQPKLTLRWESLRDRIPRRHISGKTVIVGHTPQPEGEILDRGYLKCIDTHCYGGGWLTALEVYTGAIWQANQAGEFRTRQTTSA